jgi:hypothetical protein
MARKSKAGARKPARPEPEAGVETLKPEGGTLDQESDSEAEAVEHFRACFETTGNPIYVFWALRGIYMEAAFRVRDSDGKSEYKPKIPEWIHGYLSFVSRNIFNLAYNRDPRTFPHDMDITTPEGKAAWRIWLHEGVIEREKAIELLPGALGMSRKGWNAFSNFDSIARKENIRDAVDRLMESEGKTLEEAALVIAEEAGYDEAQSVLRIRREAMDFERRTKRGQARKAKPTP